jgi:hypothetical protein
VVDSLALAADILAVRRQPEGRIAVEDNLVVAVADKPVVDRLAVVVIAVPVDIVLEVLRNFLVASAVLPAPV